MDVKVRSLTSRACSVAAALVLIATGPAGAWTKGQRELGEKAHPQILAAHGGTYDDLDLAVYVDNVGRRLVSASTASRERWSFIVLDTPEINAFALPGGYVYVTRGLLALANSEAELAGVLAHEIAHVIADHGTARQERGAKAGIGVIAGTILGGVLGGRDSARDVLKAGTKIAAGYLAAHTREEEYEADRLGIRIMVRAGYDPEAQADFLDNLAEQAGLMASLEGRVHDPNKVGFFDTHPPTAGRIEAALREARETGLPVDQAWNRGELEYMAAINGMIYGDSPEQGFVRGLSFLHPILRFGFDVPLDFSIRNRSDRVVATHRSGAYMVMDGVDQPGTRLDSYIRDRWAPELTRGVSAGYLYDLQSMQINGLPAASAFQPFEDDDGAKVAQLVIIRHGNRHYRFRAVAKAEDIVTSLDMSDAIESFRALDPDEADALQPYTIRTYRVREGDTMNLMAAAMPIRSVPERRFRVLNDYDDGKVMLVGDIVKLIME